MGPFPGSLLELLVFRMQRMSSRAILLVLAPCLGLSLMAAAGSDTPALDAIAVAEDSTPDKPPESIAEFLGPQREPADAVDAYFLNRNRTPVKKLRDYIVKRVLDTENPDIQSAALADLASNAGSFIEMEDAITVLEALLGGKPEPAIQQSAALVRARLLMRTGRKSEAKPVFEEAIEKNWKAAGDTSAEEYYTSAIADTDDWSRAAVEAFNLAIQDRPGADRSKRNFFWLLYDKIWNFVRRNPPQTAMGAIFPQLDETPLHPEYKLIARAVCMMADKQYKQAISSLIEIEKMLEEDESHSPNAEYRNIPHYIAAAMYLAGGGLEESANDYLEEYWARNRHRPAYVLRSIMSIHYKTRQYAGTTAFLIEKGFADDETLREQIPSDLMAHFLDMHAMNLCGVLGRETEGQELFVKIVEEYFPTNAGSTNALHEHGKYLARIGKTGEAEAAFLRVLGEGRFDSWLRNSRQALLNLWKDRGEPIGKVLMLLDELRTLSSLKNQFYYDQLEAGIRTEYAMSDADSNGAIEIRPLSGLVVTENSEPVAGVDISPSVHFPKQRQYDLGPRAWKRKR